MSVSVTAPSSEDLPETQPTSFYTAHVHASDMSEKCVQISDNHRHEFECPRCGHCCREWVGLTDEERFLNDARSAEEIEYAKAIEAKLKEKNT